MAQVEGMIHPGLARILESNRDELNRLYRQRAGLHPQAGDEEFLRSFGALAGAAAGPILGDARLRGSAGNVVRGVFLAALELSGRGRLGAEGSGLEKGLAALLSAFPGPVAQDPERFVRSAAAAMEAAAGKSDGAHSAWLALMASCGGAISGMDDFLDAGLAAAWLAGMPQYRRSALRALSGLPRQTVSLLLGLGKPGPGVDPAKAVEALSADPWHDPTLPTKGANPPQAYFTAAGGWSGYGGQFEAPPTLKVVDGEALAVDGKSAYRLFADRWGTFLLYEPNADTGPAGKPPMAELALQADGFRFGGKSVAGQEIEFLAGTGSPWNREGIQAGSSLLSDGAIYFTVPLSFRIFVIGLPGLAHGKDPG